ncbi:MAG: segregation/condensation protein A [bacterium]|nr:segregation/condensation protein A [bacterium]
MAVQNTAKSAYNVSIEQFEGPLDLLLHLVRDARLDITEISLAAVAHQYFAYLENLRRLDIELESSYLLVFAQLLELKSRYLLPDEVIDDQLELGFVYDTAPDEDDPLVERLSAYALVKEASEWFSAQEALSQSMFAHPVLPEANDAEIELIVSLEDLAEAMARIERMAKVSAPRVAEVQRVVISVPEMMEKLWEKFTRKPFAKFYEVLGSKPSREMIIVTFLALLELAKERRLHLEQNVAAGDIDIIRLNENEQ